MPRLTDRDYLFYRAYLYEVWQTRRQALALISTTDQWYLHQYFRLSEALSEVDALEHRRLITVKWPSLPHCAGRALRHLADPKPLRQAIGAKRVVLHPLLRPNPDVSKLVRTLLMQVQGLRDLDSKTYDDNAH